MHVIIVLLICLFPLVILVLGIHRCVKTCRNMSDQKKLARFMKVAALHRGEVGRAQQWRCASCQAIMLSSFKIIAEGQTMFAVCERCACKYDSIYQYDELDNVLGNV